MALTSIPLLAPTAHPHPDHDRLLEAVRRDRLDEVKGYLRQGLDPQVVLKVPGHAIGGPGGSVTYNLRSPLGQAVYNGPMEMVVLLMAHGARPFPGEVMDVASVAVDDRLVAMGWPDPSVRTASFGCSVERLNLAMVERHLERAARTWVPDVYGRTPLHHLMARLGKRSHQDRTAEEGYRTLVPRLLDQGVDVNAVDASGTTALHDALVRFHQEEAKRHPSWLALQEHLVLQLIDAGADVNAVSPEGSPLMLALAQARYADRVVPALLHRGARLGYPTAESVGDGFDPTRAHPGTALIGAVSSGDLGLVKLAVALGEPLDRPARLFSYPGQPVFFTPVLPLERAALMGHWAIFDHLMDAGASLLDLRAGDGWARLMQRRDAMRSGQKQAFNTPSSAPDAAQRRADQIAGLDRLEERAILAEQQALREAVSTVHTDDAGRGPATRVRPRI